MPSVYIKELRKAFSSEEEFLKVMSSHLISKEALAAMESDDFETFILEREETIRSRIAEKIEIRYRGREYTQISPQTPFDNKMAIINTIEECEDHLYWVDKYFSKEGLTLIREYVKKEQLREIKVLTSIKRVNNILRFLVTSH